MIYFVHERFLCGVIAWPTPEATSQPEPKTAGRDRDAQPDLDAIVEAIVYLYTESRRITKGSPGATGSPGRSSRS